MKQLKLSHIVMFVVWPFGALLTAFYNLKQANTRFISLAFIVFFSSTFVIVNTTDDSFKQRREFLEYAEHDYSFEQFKGLLYNEETGEVDILEPLLMYAVSKFSESATIYFMVMGFLLGFFFTKNLFLLIEYSQNRTWYWIFLTVFAFVVPFWLLSGFRYHFATHVCLYGFLLFLLKGRKLWGVLFIASSIFIHFSYLIVLPIFAIYLLTGKRLFLFSILLVASELFQMVNLENTVAYLDYLPDVFQRRSSGYLEDWKPSFQNIDNRNWYVKVYGKSLHYSAVILFLLVVFKNLKWIRKNRMLLRVFSFSALMCTVANLIADIPSAGRFLNISHQLLLICIVLFLAHTQHISILLKRALRLSLIPLSLWMVVTVRSGLDFMSVTSIFGNIISASMDTDPTPLIEILK